MAKYSSKKSLSREGVETITALNDLSANNRDIGTIIYVSSENLFYIKKTNTGDWKALTETSYYSGTPTYTLIKNPIGGAVDEGDTMTVTISTTGVTDGTSVGYLWEGISSSDVTGGSFQGTAIIYNGIATVTLIAKSDLTTEDIETATLSLDSTDSLGNPTNATSAVFTITDTSTTPVDDSLADYTINVTNSGASAYTMSGTDRNGAVSGSNPTLTFYLGDVVDFVVNASGHPFFLKTVANTDVGDTITIDGSEIPNNGTTSGTIRWTVHTVSTFYYICQYHGSMTGTINATAVYGGILYDTPGTYTWTAPDNVTLVSTVVVGGGGVGDYNTYGGMGGSLAWKNSIPVIPGQEYDIVVGAGGTNTSTGTVETQSEQSYFISTSTVKASGGRSAGQARTYAGNEWIGSGGGRGGYGSQGGGYVTASKSGGGAGGYSGDGGHAGEHGQNPATTIVLDPGEPGTGGGGGGAGHYSSGNVNFTGDAQSAGGGGVGVYGQGANGAGGLANSATSIEAGGGGSGGDLGAVGASGAQANGGEYGGGGGVTYRRASTSSDYTTSYPGLENTSGGGGAVRIIWGSNRQFPSTNVALADSNGFETTYEPPPDFTISVTASGASHYILTGTDRNGAVSGNDPSLTFQSGDSVRFIVNSPGHPFYIKTAPVIGTNDQVVGILSNGTANGIINWVIQDTGNFYYQCGIHISMSGTIESMPAPGEVIFTTTSDTTNLVTSWTVPLGVTSVSAVVIGGGGGGGQGTTVNVYGQAGGGGAGGGLAYGTFAVTPGETLDIQVGGGGGVGRPGVSGGDSAIIQGLTTLLEGGGGSGGTTYWSDAQTNGQGGTSSGAERDGGGIGGASGDRSFNAQNGGGGGGAAGYSGNGGRGKRWSNTPSNGAGGGGGGGFATASTTGAGGGVGIFGEGDSGVAGTELSLNGTGGSSGSARTSTAGTNIYGGGGRGYARKGGGHENGAPGAVRIIWGAGRSFPDNAS